MNTPTLQFELLKVGYCTHPECIAVQGGKWKSVDFPALCGLLFHPQRGYILFDTGYSPHFWQSTQNFPERLYRWTTPAYLTDEDNLIKQLEIRGIKSQDIQCIIISHLHGDHIAGIKDFSNTQFIISKKEWESFVAKNRFSRLSKAYLTNLIPNDFINRVKFIEDTHHINLPKSLLPFQSGWDIFSDGSVIAIPLPGHSAGQIGIFFYQQSYQSTFMIADACWKLSHLRNNQQSTWIAQRIMDNSKMYQHTFRQLSQAHQQNPEHCFIPSHCQETWEQYRNQFHSHEKYKLD